ncbi:MAG: hypothetical protein CM15mP36_12840 [Flavobacteriales bacterium]|nr:MAG: hypothetical protein CM15mP36_12840 [Flavobacteriales bacterium]
MEVKDIEIIDKAIEFENRKHVYKSTNEKIVASREVKSLILELNEIYKENKDSDIMDMMKRLTVIKRKVEKRLKGRPGS